MGNCWKHLFEPTLFPSPMCKLCELHIHVDKWPYLLSSFQDPIIHGLYIDWHNKALWHSWNSSSHTTILDANVFVNDSTLNDFPTKIIVPPWFLPCSCFQSKKCSCLVRLHLDILLLIASPHIPTSLLTKPLQFAFNSSYFCTATIDSWKLLPLENLTNIIVSWTQSDY